MYAPLSVIAFGCAATLLAFYGHVATRGGLTFDSGIAAFGDITITARDLIEQDVLISSHLKEDSLKFKGFGFERKRLFETVSQRASTASYGGDVIFTAIDGDIRSTGSGLSAARDLSLSAGGDIALLAKSLEVVNKTSSFGATDLGLTWNYVNSTWNDFTTETSTAQAGRNLTFLAGNDVIGEAAAVAAGGDLVIDAGRDVRFRGFQNDKFYEEWGFTLAVDFMGKDLLVAAAEGDLQGMKDAALGMTPMAQNVIALAQAEDGWDLGAAIVSSGIEAFNLASAAAAGTGDLLSSVTGGWSEAFDGQKGGGPTITVSLNAYEQNEYWTETFFSSLFAGGDMSITAGRDLELLDGTSAQAMNDLTLAAARDIAITAARDIYESDGWNAGLSVSFQGGVPTGVGASGGVNSADGTTFTNAAVQAGGTLTVQSGRDTTVEGANLRGGDVDLDVGRYLTVRSLQDLFESKAINAGIDVGFSGKASPGRCSTC